MATRHGEIFKEINALCKNLSRLTVEQAVVDSFEYDEASNEHKIYIFITPNDGPYKNVRTQFEIRVEEKYPDCPPAVYCLNTIYHPNIDLPDEENDGKASICVSTLDSDWQPEIGLDGCIMSILFLFYNPNPEDALNPVFGGEEMSDEEFAENVRKAVKGEEVEGFTFDKLLLDNSSEDATTSVAVTDIGESEVSDDAAKAEEPSPIEPAEGEVFPDVSKGKMTDKLVERKKFDGTILDNAITDKGFQKGYDTQMKLSSLCEIIK